MRYIKYKFFYNYEKEEQWLNKLSNSGYALVDYFWARYTFEPEESGRYEYKVEFLESRGQSMENIAYTEFLHEMGVECCGIYMHWAIFRRPKSDTPFEFFTDYDSKINQMRRLRRWWIGFSALEYLLCLYQILFAGFSIAERGYLSIWTIIIATIGLLAATSMMMQALYANKKLKHYKRMKKIYEN